MPTDERTCECGRKVIIHLEDHSAPYRDIERGKCPCGKAHQYKSRYIHVNFKFEESE